MDLTEAGRSLARKAESDIARAVARLTAHLTTRERRTLADLLERMLAPSSHPPGEPRLPH